MAQTAPVAEGWIRITNSNERSLFNKTNAATAPAGVTWGCARYTTTSWTFGSYASPLVGGVGTFVTLRDEAGVKTLHSTVVSVTVVDDKWFQITFAGYINATAYMLRVGGNSLTNNDSVVYSGFLKASMTDAAADWPSSLWSEGVTPGPIAFDVFVFNGSGGGGGGGATDMTGVVAALQEGLGPNPDNVKKWGNSDLATDTAEQDRLTNREIDPESGELSEMRGSLTGYFGLSEGGEGGHTISGAPTAPGGEAYAFPTSFVIPMTGIGMGNYTVSLGPLPGDISITGGPAFLSTYTTALSTYREWVRAFLLFMLVSSTFLLLLEALRQY